MPGVGSTVEREPFTRGKYLTNNGNVEEVISSTPLQVSDSTKQSFNHTYTWKNVKPHVDEIGALIYVDRRVSNGKVSTHQTGRQYIKIRP